MASNRPVFINRPEIDFLKPHAANVTKKDSTEILFCDIKGIRATGRLSSDGFIVYKSSFAVLDERDSTKKYPHPAIIRKNLVDEGVLKKSGDGLEFVRDHEFSSPSAAASVIHGGHANGLTAWKDKEGTTLKEKEAKEIE